MKRQEGMDYYFALEAAQDLVARIRASETCRRARIAGSVRRQKGKDGGPGPNDIEIVVEPYKAPLFSQWCDKELARGTFEKRQVNLGINLGTRWGHGTKLAVFYYKGVAIPVDIFAVLPPATWGVIYALRTGPGNFNKLLVSTSPDRGRKVAGGRVWDVTEHQTVAHWPAARFLRVYKKNKIAAIPTPDEQSFFKALDIPYWRPEERTEARLREFLRQKKLALWARPV